MARKNTPQQTCPNSHPANSNGNCFNSSCAFSNSRRHDAIGGLNRGPAVVLPPPSETTTSWSEQNQS